MAQNALDILGPNIVQVNDDFVLIINPTSYDSIDQELQETCKILKFSSEWNFDEILSTISKLEPQNYPNLFIFIIEVENFGFWKSIKEKLREKVKNLQENLLKFGKNRPMVLQLTSKDENVTKFYYKEESAEEFLNAEEPTKKLKKFNDFSTFLWMFLNRNFNTKFEDKMLKTLPVQSSSLILRFLRTLEIPETFYNNLIHKYYDLGLKLDLLVILDKNFEEKDKIHESKLKFFTKSPNALKLIVKTALKIFDQKVVNFLMKNCKDLLQDLSFSNQTLISSTAHESVQIDFLCNFIKSLDFPFPNNFNAESATDERLREIIDCRTKFFDEILAENIQAITKFLENNPTLANIYNISNESAIIYAIENGKLQSFHCILDKLSKDMSTEKFESFILALELFQSIICSPKEMKDIEAFINVIVEFTDEEFVRKRLTSKNHSHLFSKLINSGCRNIQQYRGFFKIMQKYLNDQEMMKVITSSGTDGFYVLHNCVRSENPRLFAILWKVLKEVFDSMNCQEKFVEIVKLVNSKQESFLHFAAKLWAKEQHQMLWRLLLNTFEDLEELKEFFMQTDKEVRNFIHIMIIRAESGVIEFTFKKFKEVFSVDQYREILNSKGNYGRNLLQIVAVESKEIEKHQILWQIISTNIENHEELVTLVMEYDQSGYNFIEYLRSNFSVEIFEFTFSQLKQNLGVDHYEEFLLEKEGEYKRNLLQKVICDLNDYQVLQTVWRIIHDFYKNDEKFIEFLKTVDGQNNNIFHLAAYFSTDEFFEFIINELDEMATNEEVRIVLRTLGMAQRNLLQLAAMENKSVEHHDYLWIILSKYFNEQEILDMIKHTDEIGADLLFYVVVWNTSEVLELTWTEIKIAFDNIENTTAFFVYISQASNEEENILHILVENQDSEKLKFLWKELEMLYASQNSLNKFKNLVSQETTDIKQNVLQLAVNCNEIEFHQVLWELLLNTFVNQQELANLIFQKNGFQNNFAHVTAVFSSEEVMELTFKKFKEILTDVQYEQILKLKGHLGRNLLHLSAWPPKEFKRHQILWKIFKDFYKFDEKLLEVLTEVDLQRNNVFHISVCYSNEDTFKILIKELKNIASNNQVKTILSTLGYQDQNLLQLAFEQFKDFHEAKTLEFHQNLWKILQEFFDNQEIVNMIKHDDANDENLLVKAVRINSKDILELTFEKIESHLTRKGFAAYLKNINTKNETILDIAARNINLEFHQIMWQAMLRTFENRDELKDFLLLKSNFSNNYIDFVVATLSLDIVNFTLMNIKESFNNAQYEEIMKSTGYNQVLWNVFCDLSKTDDNFEKFIKKDNSISCNVIHYVVAYSTKEMLEFIVNEIDKITTHEEIRDFLDKFEFDQPNLLQIAAIQNMSVELHEHLWGILRKYFNSSEIINMIKHNDKDGKNLFHLAIEFNSKAVVELTWIKIQSFIQQKDNQVEFLRTFGNMQVNLFQVALNNKLNPDVYEFCKDLISKFY